MQKKTLIKIHIKQHKNTEENYDEAKKCKIAIERLKQTSQQLAKLEKEKQIAVQTEDYDLAKQLKVKFFFLFLFLFFFCLCWHILYHTFCTNNSYKLKNSDKCQLTLMDGMNKSQKTLEIIYLSIQ